MSTIQVVQKGDTNVQVTLRIIDDTDGSPETGVLWNTAGMALEYRREGAVSTAITEATLAALTTAHTDGGFLEIGNGYYRFDVPDLAFATGASHVLIHGTVTGMVVIGVLVQLVDYDPEDAVRLGLTALPNAAADAAGGLPISDAGGLALDTKLANTNEVTVARMGALTDWINGGRLDLLLDAIPTTAMRGTDSAALASVCTEGRLAELDGANLPTDVAAIPTTAMRGTDSALLASSAPTNFGALGIESDGDVTKVNLCATTTTNTDVRGTDSALLASTFSTMFAGISVLADWLGMIFGKQSGDATALTELKATGGGSGTFDPTTDSLEALRDNQSGGALVEIRGVATVASSTYHVTFMLIVNGVLITSGLSVLVTTIHDEDGTDLVISGSPSDSSGFVNTTGTLTTAVTDNTPVLVKVGATYGGTAYSSILPAVNIA